MVTEHSREGVNVYEPRGGEKTAKAVFAGSSAEVLAGAAAIVLAILGLASLYPHYMISIATIVVGGALMFEGVATAARFSDLKRRTGAESSLEGGMSGEILGGAVGIVLGILALLNVYPVLLNAVAVIVFGGSLLLGSAATASLRYFAGSQMDERARTITREAIEVASGTELLIGIGIVVLGILALVGMDPRTLILVSLLAAGATVLMTGAALTSRTASELKR